MTTLLNDALTDALDLISIGRPYSHWPASGVISTPYDSPYNPTATFVDHGLARAVAEILNACNEGRLVRTIDPRNIDAEPREVAT